MSYEIVYNKAFIKTTRGIIPLLLSGSNNCTEYHLGRERREREWGLFWGNKHIEIDAQDLLTFMADYGAGDNCDFCKYGNKWLTSKDAYDFYKKGIKNAHTLEEWLENGHYKKYGSMGYLRCFISDWSNGYGKLALLLDRNITTTKDLEAWIDEAKRLINGRDNMYMCFKYPVREPLIYKENKEISGQCIVACSRHKGVYLSDLNTLTSDKKEAKVFKNQKEAEAYCTQSGYSTYNVKIIKYNTNEKTPVKNCYVRVDKYHTFARFSKYGFRYYCAIGNIKQALMTEKRAQQVIEKLKGTFGDKHTFEIEKVETLFKRED